MTLLFNKKSRLHFVIFCSQTVGLVVEGNNIRDPLQHPAAQYVIVEKIFGDIQKRTIKKTMNQLLQNNGKRLKVS